MSTLPSPQEFMAEPEWAALDAAARGNVVDNWAMEARKQADFSADEIKELDGIVDQFHQAASEGWLEWGGRIAKQGVTSGATSMAALPGAVTKLGLQGGKGIAVAVNDELSGLAGAPVDEEMTRAKLRVVAPDALQMGANAEKTVEGVKAFARQYNPLSENDEKFDQELEGLRRDVLDRKLPDDPDELYKVLKRHGVRISQAAATFHGENGADYFPMDMQGAADEETVKQNFRQALTGQRVGDWRDVDNDTSQASVRGFLNQSRSLVASPENLGLLMQYSATRNPKYFEALKQRLGRSREKQRLDAETKRLEDARVEDELDKATRFVFGLGGNKPEWGERMVQETRGMASSPVDMAVTAFSFGMGKAAVQAARAGTGGVASRVAQGLGAEYLSGAASGLQDQGLPTVQHLNEEGLMEMVGGGVIQAAGATVGMLTPKRGTQAEVPTEPHAAAVAQNATGDVVVDGEVRGPSAPLPADLVPPITVTAVGEEGASDADFAVAETELSPTSPGVSAPAEAAGTGSAPLTAEAAAAAPARARQAAPGVVPGATVMHRGQPRVVDSVEVHPQSPDLDIVSFTDDPRTFVLAPDVTLPAEAASAVPAPAADPAAPRDVAPDVDLFGDVIEESAGTQSFLDKMETQEVPLVGLRLSRDVPQFKTGANEQGVVQPLEGKYERMGTAPILVWERRDGTREVISGRHRFDLAKRTGEQTIPAQVVREADGFTREHALTADAELNIRDGQGEVSDYANYFRHSGIEQAEARSRGLLARAKGRTGWSIGTEASEGVFDLHANGRLTDAQAEAVARTAPRDEGMQAVGAQAILDGDSIEVATNLMRAVRSELGGAPSPTQLDLFGRDNRAMQDMRKMAKSAAQQQRTVREQIAAVQGAVKRPEQARKLGVDVADPAAVQARVEGLKQELARWENWPLHDDLRARVREGAGLQPPSSQTEAGSSPAEIPPGEPVRAPSSKMHKWADEVIRESQGRTNMNLDPTLAAAYGVKGASLIAEGFRSFAAWSREMLRRFGEGVRVYLKGAWAAAIKTSRTGAIDIGQGGPVNRGKDPVAEARAAATMANASVDSQSRARPLQEQFGGAPQDYWAYDAEDMKARAKAVVDAIGSVEAMARLLSSEQGVQTIGLSPALKEFVQAETLRRASAAADAATNDVDRIRATQTLRRLKSLWDVSGTEAGQHLVSRQQAGADLFAPMAVDDAIEKRQKETIDRAVPVEETAQAVETAAEAAGPAADAALADKLDAEFRGTAPVPTNEQTDQVKVLRAQVDAYFEGNTPARVQVTYDAQSDREAWLKDGTLYVNAAALSDPSTADVARVLEHEIGHGLYSDPQMRSYFSTLWWSLDVRTRAEIENYTAERYAAAERTEEDSVRGLDAVRELTRGLEARTAWQRFQNAAASLWQRFTGRMPKDPAALAARMIQVGVQRLRAGKPGAGLKMSKRTDLLKTDAPALVKLLNQLRGKIKPGLKWKDIFVSKATQQRQWELEVYARIRKHQALQALSPQEAMQLTREMSKAWQRERRKVFNRELQKQLNKVSGIKARAAAKVAASAPRLLQLINLGAFDSQTFRDAIAKEWRLADFSSPEAKRLKALAQRIQDAPEGVPRRKLEQEFIEGLQDLTKLTKAEILDSWWTAAVLSGWRTHTDIILGVANGIEDVGLGSLVTAVRTGNADVAYRAIGRVLGNLPQAIQEALHHLVTGDKSMMRNFDAEVKAAMQDGHKLMGAAGRQLINKGGIAKVPGAFMELISRLLRAWDHINSTSTFEGAKMMAMARHPQLYQAALKIGPLEKAHAKARARAELTAGVEPQNYTERLQENARIKEILDAGVPTEIISQAREMGLDAALQGEPSGMGYALWWLAQQIPGFLENTIKSMETKKAPNNLAARTVLRALRMAAPLSRITLGTKFVRTVSHALNRQISYVPGVGLARFAEEGIRHSAAKADVLIAKQLLGTVVGLSILAMLNGKDDDEEGIEGGWKGLTPQQRGQLYAQGKQPNTVWYRNAQGKIVSFNYLQWGLAGILNTVGSMEDQRRYQGNQDGLAVLVSGIMTGSMAIGEKTQMQGLVQAIWGQPAYSSASPSDGIASRLNRYASTTVGGIVPRIVKDVDMVISPELRDTSQWWAKWAAQVPMVRQLSGGKRVDIFGQDIKLDRSPLSRVVLTGTSDPAYRLLGQLNQRDIWLPDPSSSERTVKLPGGERREMTPAEKDRFQRLAGEGYKTFVEAQAQQLLSMPVEDAREYIKSYTKRVNAAAAMRAVQR